MPPKKKKDKSEVSSSKKTVKASGKDAAGQDEPLSELSKEYYLVQIRDLESRLTRYQQRCDELTLRKDQYEKQYDQLLTEKKEIVAFLKRSLDQRIDDLADLNDRLIGLQQAKDGEKDAYEAQLTQLRHELQETKDQLTSENMLLAGKLASLEEFRVQKEDLMAKFVALEEHLKKQEEERKQLIYELERKAVVDKDRLKKEMVQRVNNVATEFRKVSNKQMAETTKRAIQENASISAQLVRMSDKSMELIVENDHLKELEKQQRFQLQTMEHIEKELAKTNVSNQKVIQMLTEKCKQQQIKMDEYETRNEHFLKVDNDYCKLQKQHDIDRQECECLREELKKKNAEMETLKKHLEEEAISRKNIEKVLSEAAYVLRDALLEEESSTANDTSEVAVHVQRSEMMDKLLSVLTTSATLVLGPHIKDFLQKTAPFIEYKIDPKGERTTLLSPVVKGPGLHRHYKLGDLGLIPRPGQNIDAHLERMSQLSKTTHLGVLKMGQKSGSGSKVIKEIVAPLRSLPKSATLPGII
ncbi:cilia- and flagella-associated protein 157-like [Protopterus annectens]|uniref:cilia- and flagella-associated protein 157-like n=1 Tax=Protopterus annectens TaxID=7888 RepID=UPI001CFAF1E3|nr:cilia- and flagella-associated protein 157-like [Protopterus annectens]